MSKEIYDLSELEKTGLSKKTGKLLYVSTAKYGGDWTSLPHSHNCTEFIYVVSGQGQVTIGDSTFAIKPNDLLFIDPNIEHTECNLEAQPLEYIVLGIEGLKFTLDGNTNDHYSLFNFKNSREDILPLLNYMLLEIQYNQINYEFVCQNLLEILIVKLIRHTNFYLNVGPVRRAAKECATVKRYIDENFNTSLTLDHLAEVAHVNKYYLVHSFSKEYGISPINYVIERRIKESCNLLRNSSHSLAHISQLLGFSSPSYFSQSFRKSQQMSPMEYRKRAHAEQAKQEAALH